MIGLAVTGTDKTAANLKRAKADLPFTIARGMRASVSLVERALKAELTGKAESDAFWGKGGAAGDQLAVRSGRTRASITAAVLKSGDTYIGVVGSPAKHLRDHEDGATVKGTSPGGFHRIPTAAVLTPAGVDRNAGRSIRNIPGAFLFRSARGLLWAAIKTGDAKGVRVAGGRKAFRAEASARFGVAGKLLLLYLLVKSITLRGRHIFARVRREQERPVTEAMRQQVAVTVARANQ